MAVESPIALSARGYLPQTWDALANSTYYGESLLDLKLKYIKFALFATVVSTSQEEDYYNPLVIEFAAKALAITIIPAGADYYSNQLISLTSTGTNETKTYPDRIAGLWLINARLVKEFEDMKAKVQQYLPTAALKNVSSVAGNSGSGRPYLSIDPKSFWPEALYATGWGNLPWSSWS